MKSDSSTPAIDAESQTKPETPKLRLTKPHPLIRRTLDLKYEKDAYGYERLPRWPGIDVHVSITAKRDELIVLDRLFKALERVNVDVSVIDGG